MAFSMTLCYNVIGSIVRQGAQSYGDFRVFHYE